MLSCLVLDYLDPLLYREMDSEFRPSRPATLTP